MARGRLVMILGLGLVGSLLAGCALLTPLPRPTTVEERLGSFPTTDLPLEGKVVVHWTERHIPFVEADTDADAAFTLGLIHAHLRLGQMATLRMIAQGRLAEVAGPVAVDIDHGLRILNFSRGVSETEQSLSTETKAWIDNFVAGINHYQARAETLPHEYAVLGLEPEPWTTSDVLTIGRLAGSDVNWLVWAGVLKLREREDWPDIWARLVANGSASLPSFEDNGDLSMLNDIVGGLSKSGSNSVAVAGPRSASGAAVMASDPHLGILAPNVWLIAGVKSPSYHAVGLMGPGLPIFALGRNPWAAWGGTNMRAASSDLYALADVPESDIAERREQIGVRWWFDEEITVRETAYGPVISDAPLFDEVNGSGFALKWTGHQVSDEIGAMMAVSRAQNFEDFQRAFDGFAVPGQNMLFADTNGNIGQVMAVRLPARNGPPPDDLLFEPAKREPSWQDMRGSRDLPYSLNPDGGFLVSGNNRPTETDLQVGYFFSPDDRVERMAEILGGEGKIDVDDLATLQRDVYMPSSIALRDVILRKLDEAGLPIGDAAEENKVVDRLRDWDGQYRADSLGAMTFEQFRDGLTERFYAFSLGDADWQAFANVGRIKSLLIEDIETAPSDQLAAALQAGLDTATDGLGDYANWGDMHRLRLAHPLGNLPVIGGRYQFSDYPIGGSTDTIMKTAHATTAVRHAVRYGSNARHISDMADLDSNYFVLLGGQDGWINSSTFLDQVPLWLAGEYIDMPLRIETVRDTFSYHMDLTH